MNDIQQSLRKLVLANTPEAIPRFAEVDKRAASRRRRRAVGLVASTTAVAILAVGLALNWIHASPSHTESSLGPPVSTPFGAVRLKLDPSDAGPGQVVRIRVIGKVQANEVMAEAVTLHITKSGPSIAYLSRDRNPAPPQPVGQTAEFNAALRATTTTYFRLPAHISGPIQVEQSLLVRGKIYMLSAMLELR